MSNDTFSYLSQDDIKKIEIVILSSQQSLLIVLLKSLNLIKKETQYIKSSNQHLFEEIIEKICISLEKIKNMSSQLENRSNPHVVSVVTAFAFYRAAFSGLIEKIDRNADKYLFLKRIPYKLFDHFGDQIWRTFELKSIIFDHIDTWVLNEDIRCFFIEEMTSNGSKNTEVIPEDKSNGVEIDEFNKFINRQLKRYPANTSEQIIHMKSYGKSVLVSRKLISDFCMKYEIENELDAIKSLGLDSISLIKDDKSHEYFVVETQIDHEKIAPEMGFQIENKGGI